MNPRNYYETIKLTNLKSVLEPADMLAELLNEYIEENSDDLEKVNQAKQLLGILSPKKYPDHLKLFKLNPNAEHNFSIFDERGHDDNVLYLIGALQKYWLEKKKVLHPSLINLLGTFFSVYEQYQGKINEEMIKRHSLISYWENSVTILFHSILQAIKNGDSHKQFQAMLALSQFNHWIPENQREKVLEWLLHFLNKTNDVDMDVREILFTTLISLKPWLPKDDRDLIIYLILEHKDSEEAAIRMAACEAIVELRNWFNENQFTKDLLTDEITDLLTRLNSEDVLLKEKIKTCVLLTTLMPVMPTEKIEEVIKTLVNIINDDSLRMIRRNALAALGKGKNIIPEKLFKLVEKNVVNHMNDFDFNICFEACEAIGQLNKIISPASIEEKLQTLMRDNRKHDRLRAAAIRALIQFHAKLPDQTLRNLMKELEQMAMNMREHINVRTA